MPKQRFGRGRGPREWPPVGTTLISFVLDKSGSMESIREATISGFNEFKHEQARCPGRALFTLTLFDTEVHRVCTAIPIAEVPDLTRASYQPGSCTALYDAVGSTILAVERHLVRTSCIDQVVFVVMTDGLENASHEFDRHRVFEMIAERQARGYEFVYLGANQDSYAESARMGIRPGRNLDYFASEASVRDTMKRLSARMSDYRGSGVAQQETWFEDLGEPDGGRRRA